MKDKPVLMYVKNNILYPIALNKDQKQALDMFMHLMPGEMHYIKGNPIGEVMEVSSNVRDSKGSNPKN